MPLSIGVNLRVTGHCNQGGRKYMEDMFSVAYQQSSNDRELEYAFFGIFDGHGGGEAATFAKENLMDIIVKQKNFWSDNDEDVLKAIRDGYVNTHYAMWRELEKWPKTASGLPSTAGTTASIAFIRKGKIYIGHVGDSAIILGYQDKDDPVWKSKALTRDHKPECGIEMSRIHESGGKVVSKSGVPRVVWNRPRLGHKGPVRRSTHIDEIPFLAVARSLGDLWSYNSELNTFVVSPEPDVKVIEIDVKTHRCLIFGTDGLWNMLTPQAAVAIVQAAEKHNEKHLIASQQTGNGQGETQMWINPSKSLVDRALDRWSSTRLRADNTSVVTLMLDPPGPTHSEILLSQKREQMASTQAAPQSQEPVYTPVHKPMPPSSHVKQPAACPHISTTPKAPPSVNPDSSNQIIGKLTATLPSEDSKKHTTTGPAKDTSKPNQSSAAVLEESIQVAEISSSNASELDETIVDVESSEVESSVCEEEVEEEEEEEEDEEEELTGSEENSENTKFLLEQKSWLQQVPQAERYPSDASNADLQPIRYSEPRHQGPRLRRSRVLETSTPLAKRVPGYSGNVVVRQTSGKRRHSGNAGTPQNDRRQQQRRSLTPKSSPSRLPKVSKALKRSCRVLIENDSEDPRIGGGAKSTGECTYEAKEDAIGEPCSKRRTRSEDLRNTQDENDPANQKVESQQLRDKLRWNVADASMSRTSSMLNSSGNAIRERRHSSPNAFKRRSLEKKATPVKTIRRPSINRSTSRIQITRDGFWDQGRASRTGASCAVNRKQTVMGLIGNTAATETTTSPSTLSEPKRWLRSDTIAATPIKTLRSRNVDIAGHTVPAQVAGQYDIVKSARLLQEPALKLNKQPATPGKSALATPTMTPSSVPQNPVIAKVKTASCSTTPLATTTPNRTKQSCSSIVTPGGSITANSSASATTTSAASITKRSKTPYNPSARSLSTRSRIKRFSK